MKTTRHKITWYVALFLSVTGLTWLAQAAPPLIPPACGGVGGQAHAGGTKGGANHDVRILRDKWGVPHIFGKTDADAAFGLGFAQCEDNWPGVQGAILVARGATSSAAGAAYVNFDYLFRLFRVRDFVDAKYETDLSPDVRAVIEAYAAGVTCFAALHPDKMPAAALPVTGKDIVAGTTFKCPFFYLLERDLAVFFAKAKDVPVSGATMLSSRKTQDDEVVGSNAWAVAPSRSADGATRLCLNSHLPWNGATTLIEAHVHSEQGWNMIGCMLAGAPFPSWGHDENKGWCHTINKPDLADIYALEVNPDNPNQYRFDGAWRDLERDTARIPVRNERGEVSEAAYELLWSVQGPVVRREDGLFALRFAGYGEVRQLEQWYRMNKARNFDEFQDALRLLALSSLNTVYADKAGNILCVYGAQIPVRAEGYDWAGTVPGNTSATLWSEVYPFEKLPQVANPKSGFVQNCNCTPFRTTVGGENPAPDAFPKSMGLEGHETNRSRRALELYGGDESITRDEFYRYKYDKTYTPKSDVAAYVDKLLETKMPEEPLLQEAVRLLKNWDRTTEKDNRAAALALLVGWPHVQRNAWAGNPPSPVNVLRQAATILMQHFARLDVPLQEALRLRHGGADLGLGGGPDCLRAIYSEVSGDGRLAANAGDCYYQMVEWGKNGALRSEAVHQFGTAVADEGSPHYTDQAALFAAEQMRPVLLDERDIRQYLEREYRPGEGEIAR